MTRNRQRRHLAPESLEKRVVLDSTVVFNEILYHPIDDESPSEFVEFHNQMAVDMDISNWTIGDGVEFKFPSGTIVPGGGFLVVAESPELISEKYSVQALGPFTGRLSNAGDRLELRDASNRLMDSIEYGDDNPWPIAPDGAGPSLAKFNEDTLSARAANWTSSYLVGGTPGQINFAANQPPEEDQVRQLIEPNSIWQFDTSGNDLAMGWRAPDFDVAAWSAGAAPVFAGTGKAVGTETVSLIGVTAEASSELASHNVNNIVDGSGLDEDGTHVNEPAIGTMWVSSGDFFGLEPDLEPEVTFDLGTVRRIEAMRFWNFNHQDSDTCCLQRGVAIADVLVAGEDGVFSTLIDNHEFAVAPGEKTDFSEFVDFGGVDAQFVKLDIDTTNGVANHGDQFSFVGISEVQFQAFPKPSESEVPIGPPTFYMRKEFDFDLAPERTNLQLDLQVDDGAVVYLNGQEIHRHNMPDGPIDFSTKSIFQIDDAVWSGVFTIPGDQLVFGKNVIAIEVHQSSDDDPDMFFDLSLSSITVAPQPIPLDPQLFISEMAGTDEQGEFFVELQNRGEAPMDLSGIRVVSEALYHEFANGTVLEAGGRTFISSESEPEPNRIVSVTSAAGDIIWSAERTSRRGQGLLADAALGAPLTFTSTATPGSENTFRLNNDIVINEILYNHRPNVSDPGTPPTFEFTSLLAFDSVWRYNDKGDDLPSDWSSTTHSIGGNWSSGPDCSVSKTTRCQVPACKRKPMILASTGS